jgi:hypothetical protein
MYTMQDPTYIDTDGCEYTYTPPPGICSLRRYNIAQCARQRMSDAHCSGNGAGWFEIWKRERESFWSTLAHAVPDNFK